MSGLRPSEIAHILGYSRIAVRSKIQSMYKTVDLDMIKDDNIFRKLVSLNEVYDMKLRRCKLCNKWISFSDVLKHLLSHHKDYLHKVLNEVLGK
jgi:hypothetical protein